MSSPGAGFTRINRGAQDVATWKTTFIFNEGKSGWSETWYKTGASLSTTINNILTDALVLKGLRTPLLGQGCVLEAIRISDVAIRGDSKLWSAFLTAPTDQTQSADAAGFSMLCRVEAGSLYRRQQWLRGIRDDWLVRDIVTGQPIAPPALTTAYTAFRLQLINDHWQLRCIDKEAPNLIVSPITGFIADGTNTKVLAAGFAGVQVGDEVRVRGIVGPDAKALNKVWKVLAADAAGVTIGLPFASLIAPALDLLGKLQTRVVVYKDITDAEMLRLATRQTGRAFFVPRGRRPPKR